MITAVTPIVILSIVSSERRRFVITPERHPERLEHAHAATSRRGAQALGAVAYDQAICKVDRP
jgi:hypothetical protein